MPDFLAMLKAKLAAGEPLKCISQVARELGLAQNTCLGWARVGRVPVLRIGGRWRSDPEIVREWIHSNQRSADRYPPAKSPKKPVSVRRREVLEALDELKRMGV